MPKQILVFGEKTFKVTIPDNGRTTFGPFSPPSAGNRYDRNEGDRKGTLRIYDGPKSTANIIAVFSGVTAFRDVTMGYEEMVTREEGAIIWKNDENEYKRTEKVQRNDAWVNPDQPKQIAPISDDVNDEITF